MTRLAPGLELNDGAHIPQIGLGVMFIPSERLHGVMADAVEVGYRHFDTATHYGNEAEVGEGLAKLDVARDDLFVVTKLPNAAHGYDEALRAFDRSEHALGRIDLYLLHWPQPPKRRYLDCWRAMARIQQEGRVRSIGVCNFPDMLIDELVAETGVTPAVNQIELHPSFQQRALRSTNSVRRIITESWSPLGHGRSLTEPTTVAIAERLNSTPAAVILRWHLDLGLVAIPKASRRDHLAANIAAVELQLTDDDLSAIAGLDRVDGGFGPDPMLHTTEQGAE